MEITLGEDTYEMSIDGDEIESVETDEEGNIVITYKTYFVE